MTVEERIARWYCNISDGYAYSIQEQTALKAEAKEYYAWFRACMEEWENEKKEHVREIFTK